jgi:3-oxoacyl-[acyl-carrier protein] reductase
MSVSTHVIVTGGSRGLGLEMVRVLAAAGYGVIAVARGPTPALEAAIAACRDAGAGAAAGAVGAIQFRPFDLSKTTEIPGFVRSLRKELGPIYGLVNNAGLGTGGVLGNMLDADVETLVRLNTLAPILLTKYVLRSMMSERAGRIVNVSSIVAATGYTGLSVYSATKASLVGFTRSLAREVGPLGITVNAIAPGFVSTDMTGELSAEERERIARRSALKRLADPIDVARSVEFLLGDGGRNITGTILTVDAGNTA